MMLLLLLLLAFMSFVSGDKLILVQSLFRHGDRTPTGTYATDPYQENFWPVSFGQLTTLGMQQHFEQGIKLRDRYVTQYNLFSAEYKDYNVYVRATDSDRTLVSAYSQLAGFYAESISSYPSSNCFWPSHWTPVPVHTVEQKTDRLLNTNFNCPRGDQIQEELMKNPKFISYMQTQQPFLQIISKNAGFNDTEFQNYWSLAKFYDAVKVEKIYNLTVPSWISDRLWNQFVTGKELTNGYLFGDSGFGLEANAELSMLRAGTLLKTMIDNMELAVANITRIKYFMYSAHDSNIISLLHTLEAKEKVLGLASPDYASVVLMELWKNEDGLPYIRVYYIRDVSSPPEPITQFIGGCGGKRECSLETFKERSQRFIPDDILKACKTV